MRESPELLREVTLPATRASPVAGLLSGLKALIGPNWIRTYGIGLGMALLLTFTAASGTGEIPLLLRLAYWLILMVLGTLVAQIAGRLLDCYASLNLWQTIALMMLITTPLICVLVWLVTAAFSTDHTLDLVRLPYLVGPVGVITLAMASLHVMINSTPAQSHAFAPENLAEPGQAFRERLPFKYRHADILALSAEDHYLRVYTSAGETLVLMRLYDAITLLDGIEGSQTHRSWWVAKAAVSNVERSDGRIALRIKGGGAVPVSRGYQKPLKEGGWF